MHDPKLPLIEDVRKLLSGYKACEFTFQKLAEDLDRPLNVLIHVFGTESMLVEEILDYEQRNLESVFSMSDLAGGNAIDSLLNVSR